MAMNVQYAEGRGEAAEAGLRALLDTLDGLEGFAGAELLSSPAQPGLWLLVSRWQGEVPEMALPDGVRAWVFEVMDHRK